MQVFADAANALDTTVSAKDLAAARKATRDAKAKASIERNTVAVHMAGTTDAGTVVPNGYTVTVLADNGRGRNARGLTGAKRGYGGSQPKGAKRAKRQMRASIGGQPVVSATRWANV